MACGLSASHRNRLSDSDTRDHESLAQAESLKSPPEKQRRSVPSQGLGVLWRDCFTNSGPTLCIFFMVCVRACSSLRV